MPAALTSAEIRSAFRRPIDPVRTTWSYKLNLLGVLLGLAALQILYLLLIAAVAALTVLYAKTAAAWDIGGGFIGGVVYLGPPAAGIIAVFFLLKPILVRPRRPPQPIRLLPADEPVLFEFVQCLCRELGAPEPSRIFVNLHPNAYAAVRGWRGLFFSDLDLTIGLPFARDLTARQFAGVLAHEFGHFAQSAGLPAYFLIQTSQHWFGRVVHERDPLDEWLAGIRKSRYWWLQLVAHLAAFVVAASRQYLALLMKAGNWLSSAFSRQMEFDADRYEAALVGADTFQETALRLPVLTVGAGLAWQDTARDFATGRLPDDAAALIEVRAACLPGETVQEIVQRELACTTGRHDTHPCTAERIAGVRGNPSGGGVFDLEGPAERLFRDLPELCRTATRHHYEKMLAIPAAKIRLVSTSATFFSAQAAREGDAAVQELFQLPAPFCSRWFRLPSGPAQVREPRSGTPDASPPKIRTEPFDSAIEMSLLHFAALTIKKTGVAVKAESFRLNAVDLESIRGEQALSDRNLRDLIGELNEQTRDVAERIESTIARMDNGQLALVIRWDRQAPIPDRDAAWRTYGALSACQDDLMDLRRWTCAARIVRQNAGVFPAAICANLLDDLDRNTLRVMNRIIEQTTDAPAAVVFDDRVPPTLGAQLAGNEGAASERAQLLLARVDTSLTTALEHLAWFTVTAIPVPVA